MPPTIMTIMGPTQPSLPPPLCAASAAASMAALCFDFAPFVLHTFPPFFLCVLLSFLLLLLFHLSLVHVQLVVFVVVVF